jgi:hypothetical protein
MDPEKLGRRTFHFLSVVIIVPDAVVGIYNTFHGIHGADIVALLTQTKYNGEGKTLLIVFSSIWILLAISLSLTAYVIIPLFLKYSQPNYQSDQLLQRTKSLKTYLLWSMVMLTLLIGTVVTRIQKTNRYRPIQPFGYIGGSIFLLLLVFMLKENDHKTAVKRYIYSLFQIEEKQSGVQDIIVQNQQESFPHFPSNETSVAMATNPKPPNNCFTEISPKSRFVLIPIQKHHNGKNMIEKLPDVEL